MPFELPTSASPAHCPNCGASLPPQAPQGLCPRCLFAGLAAPTEVDAPSAAPAPSPTPEELAPHFPQLEILECLGRGGMGVVYKARQKSLNRLVALKLLAPERADDPQFAERFSREAQALASLNHPHIVAVHDFGRAGGFYFLIMEFVDGVNLRQLLQAKRLTPQEALSIVPPICEALQCAHDRGIVHRDIKPENLLIDKAGTVKIADFGIARIVTRESAGGEEGIAPRVPSRTTMLGTPDYAAPEQHERAATADHRADIYSLGVVLYEMLTGERPRLNFVPPSKRIQVDVRIDEIVLRALERAPELRFATATEFRTQVENLSGGIDQAPAPVTIASGPGREAAERFSRTAIAGACCAIYAVIVVPAFIAHEMETREFWDAGPFHSGPMFFFFFLLILPGFIAPFAATLFGWISVSQIRRSAGKLHGLWLAVFDGLIFLSLLPGVILGLLGMLLYQALHAVAPGSIAPYDQAIRTLGQLLILVVWLVVDYFIVRRVWRAVNQGSSGTVAPPAGVARPGGMVPGHFSRTAIVSAAWMPFAVAAAAFMLSVRVPFERLNLGAALAIFASLSGFFGSTVLGWVAVSQIRRSAGRIYGMWLAVFDGLCFPLAALAAAFHLLGTLLYGALGWITHGSLAPYEHPIRIIAGVLGGLIWLTVAYLLFRRVWRTVSQPPPGAVGAISPATSASSSAQRASRIEGAMVAALLILVGIGGWYLVETIQHPAKAGRAEKTWGSLFVEREVTSAAGFGSGELAQVPERLVSSDPAKGLGEHAMEVFSWIESRHLDAVLEKPRSFLGVGMKIRSVGNEAWGTMTPDDIQNCLAGTVSTLSQPLPPGDQQPATYVFQTREGRTGLLQVLNFTDQGVKLRYQLLIP